MPRKKARDEGGEEGRMKKKKTGANKL